jgi:hypothetical protein
VQSPQLKQELLMHLLAPSSFHSAARPTEQLLSELRICNSLKEHFVTNNWLQAFLRQAVESRHLIQ